MKKALLMAVVMLFAGTVSLQAQMVLKLAETHPKGYPTELADEYFAQLVTERSGGKIKVEVYPGSSLGEEKAAIEQVQLGAIAFTRVSSGPMAEFNKALGAFSLPYIFDDSEHMWNYLMSADGQKLLDGLSASRFVGLCYFDPGARSFYSFKPITKLEDLKGLKIRVIQNTINMELMKALGASATPMPYGQVFSSLQTQVIDAAENNFPSYLTANHYQVAKHYLVDAHQRVPEVLVISKVVFDGLAKADQDLIRQAAKDSVAKQRELWSAFEKEAEAKVKAEGSVITYVKDLKPFQDAVKPVFDAHPEYAEVLKDISKARTSK
jgi:tripartite ATP-independent transporter DctP family solute receptor